jgi:hypothetical protein
MEDGEQTLAYKRCTIFYSSRLDADSLQFVPSTAIAWESRGSVMMCFLRSLKPKCTKHEAETAAVEQAKAWIAVNPTLP